MLGKYTLLPALATIASVVAQRPSDVSICDYYTSLHKDNTPTNQYALLTLLVNTAVIGNYTEPSNGVLVPGILNPKGMYNGVPVNLLPYFNAGLKSTNDGPTPPDCQDFLDGGQAAPLMMNKPADDTTSNQYMLLTHLYQYFGLLLGCTGYGMPGFPKYGGDPSMYNVHKYMDLDPNEIGYFIAQVGLSAASLGVTAADITVAANALNKYFGYKCSPAAMIVPGGGAVLNSICVDPSCPPDPMPTCDAYPSLGTGTPPATCPMAVSPTSMSATTPCPTSTPKPTSTPMSMSMGKMGMTKCPVKTITKTESCHATAKDGNGNWEWNCS